MGTCVVCADCRAGEYRAGCGGKREGSCTRCESGNYASGAGYRAACTTCSSCPVGKSISTDCKEDSDTTCSDNELSCAVCGDGEYLEGCTSTYMGTCNPCAQCGVDHYVSGCVINSAGMCQTCPSNMASPSGSRALADCQCKSGFGSTDNAVCVECTAGKYKGSDDKCTVCEAGKFSPSAGAISCTLCSTCLVGQVETVPCGSSDAVTNRDCGSCSDSTKPSNARWTAADDCLKWVCSDGYQPRDTPKGVHTSRCVLPPPAAGQLVSTVSIELTLRGVTPAQVYEKEEELVSAFSKLVQEDAGNIFLLSVQEARTARHTFPLHLSADVTHASPRALPSSSMHSDSLGGGGVRSDTQVTIGVRTDKPAQVQQGISLTGTSVYHSVCAYVCVWGVYLSL